MDLLLVLMLYVYFNFESLIVQDVHNYFCQYSFLQQLKLKWFINMENQNTHSSAWIHVEQFALFFSLCISDCNKLLELKIKLEFRELMYNMIGMGADMA